MRRKLRAGLQLSANNKHLQQCLAVCNSHPGWKTATFILRSETAARRSPVALLLSPEASDAAASVSAARYEPVNCPNIEWKVKVLR